MYSPSEESSVAFEAKKLTIGELKEKARTLRKHVIRMTTEAGSGHPSSSLSAADVVTALFFGGFKMANVADVK